MKKFLITCCVILLCSTTFGQKLAKLNLKDSCIMSGGIIAMSDFKKLCKICPPEAKKITAFNISYPINAPFYGDHAGKGNRYDSKFLLQYAKPSAIMVIDNIKATGADGRYIQVQRMTLGFK